MMAAGYFAGVTSKAGEDVFPGEAIEARCGDLKLDWCWRGAFREKE
jgi:hypothetical protein